MTVNGEYLAVLDRFEENLAVLLLEQDGELVDELVVPVEDLPEQTRHQDAVLTVTIDGGELIDASYDADETVSRQNAAQDRFDRLADRPQKDDEH